MGYTSFEVNLLSKYLPEIKTVLDLGSQNLYTENFKFPPFVSEWYRKWGIDYSCIDLAGDNNALQYDLSRTLVPVIQYDMVVDAGTSEHVVQMKNYESMSFHDGHIHSIYPKEIESIENGYYNCWLNKHNFLKAGGIMVSINPKTGNWPGHGYTYVTQDFYKELEKITDYQILELGEDAAMGNVKDGWNIYCVLKKNSEVFPDFEVFQYLETSFS